MLPIPTTGDDIVCIIGIDPGSETLGVGIIHFNVNTLKIVKTQAKTYTGSKLSGMEWMAEAHGDRMQRIYRHSNNLINIFNEYNPIIVAAESAFINIRRPAAYGALTEVFFMIRNAVICYDPWCPFYNVEPSNTKRAVGAPGNADKTVVKEHLLKIDEVCSVCETPIELLDEHSIDSLCVAYFQFLKYK